MAIGITTLLWADLSNRFVWCVLIVTLGFGAIGWVDDYRKVVHRNPKGLSAREKYFWQSLIGGVAAVYLAFAISAPSTAQIGNLSSRGCSRASRWTCRPRPTSSCRSSRTSRIRSACSASSC